jgi:hypothetical protein
MRRVLERVGSCSLIALVLDHDSFAHTVENVFALSFLCKWVWQGTLDLSLGAVGSLWLLSQQWALLSSCVCISVRISTCSAARVDWQLLL